MAVTNISKVSGVLLVTEGTLEPKAYFNASGKYVPASDQLSFGITIAKDTYNISLADLRVNGQTPANFTTAKVLLNAVFAAAASALSISTFAAGTSTFAVACSVVGAPANSLLVLCTGENASVVESPAVSSSPSLTWTKQVENGVISGNNSQIWTAIFPAGGNITVTADWPGAEQFAVCYALVNYDQVAYIGNFNSANSQALPSVAVTTTRANSILFCVTADFNAQDGSTRAYRDSATETQYYRPSGAIAGYNYYKQAGAIATYTEGLTLPTTQKSVTCVLEIKGN